MAAKAPTVRVKGLRELQRAIKGIDADLSKDIDTELKRIAELVGDTARARFSTINTASALGFKPRVKGFGRAVVVQTRRSKKLRPDYGGLQMVRGLIPALWERAHEVEREMETLITRLSRNHGF